MPRAVDPSKVPPIRPDAAMLSPAQVSVAFGVSISKLEKMRADGDESLKFVRQLGRVLYPRRAVEQFFGATITGEPL